MKNTEGKKEVMYNGKRFILGERAANIAINHFGATEVIKFTIPSEVGTKTTPSIIKPVPTAKDINEPIEVKPRKTRKK